MKFDVKEIIGCYRKLIYKSIRRDREKQIIECLSCEKDAGFNIRKVEYRKTYQKIKKQLHKKSNYVTRAELNQIKKLCRKWV